MKQKEYITVRGNISPSGKQYSRTISGLSTIWEMKKDKYGEIDFSTEKVHKINVCKKEV